MVPSFTGLRPPAMGSATHVTTIIMLDLYAEDRSELGCLARLLGMSLTSSN
jgi:hypothetical protein